MRLIYLFVKCFFNRPIHQNNSRIKSCSFYPKFLSPLRNIHRFSIKSYLMVASSIVILFFASGPFNISWYIAKIIINSFNSMLRSWSIPDIIIKFIKRFSPFFIYCYSTSTIIFKTLIIWICASFYHVIPSLIFRRMTFIMGKFKMRYVFISGASATFAFSVTQILTACYSYIATITLTFPMSTSAIVFRNIIHCGEFSEFLSCKIDKFCHDITSWLKVVVEKVCWKAVNQFPLFGSYPIQHVTY